MVVYDEKNGYSSIIVVNDRNCGYFNVCMYFPEWKVLRLIWIGFYKNDDNQECKVNTIPKDIVNYIFKYLIPVTRNFMFGTIKLNTLR